MWSSVIKTFSHDHGVWVRREKPLESIHIDDLWNPWNFNFILSHPQEKVHDWLRKEELLADIMWCNKCEYEMTLNERGRGA